VTAALAVDALRSLTLAATVPRFALESVELDREFQSRRGDWNGRPLTLHTEIFAGGGRLSRIHIATIEAPGGAIASLTVLGFPSSASGAPMFGADLVAFGDAFATAILDVIPLSRAIRSTSVTQLTEARAGLERCGESRVLTGDGPSPFSANASIVTPRSSHEAELELERAYRAYLDVFVGELSGPEVTEDVAPASRRAQREFLSRLAGVKKQMKALTRLFGAEWTSAYFDDVFLCTTAIS
jgi:hypothetical protein